ncbi:unnamed protein product [Rangifer tarandus platyrhynchus]|uniref:Uncharacterized protein n=1 Tax=Rangifer tarandus platyrhynchus TaxID=3082113 RepID=A0AC59Y4H6_RANTA
MLGRRPLIRTAERAFRETPLNNVRLRQSSPPARPPPPPLSPRGLRLGSRNPESLYRGDGVPGEHEGSARLPEAVRRQPRPGTPGTPNSGGGETIGAREACKAAEPQKAPRERGPARGWSGPQGPAGARSLPTWLALRPAGSCGSPRGLGARPSRHRAPTRGNHRAAEASCRDRRECRERSAPAREG